MLVLVYKKTLLDFIRIMLNLYNHIASALWTPVATELAREDIKHFHH